MDCFCPLKFKAHFGRTSTRNRDNMFYVTKTETSVGGPWHDTDPKPVYVPRQVRKITQ